MTINLNKDKFKAIDGAFKVLKEDYSKLAPLEIIKENLEDCFKGLKFTITMVKNENEVFFMSVYPEISTVDKIISAISSGKEDKVVQDLWAKNKAWTIEMDSTIFNDNLFTERELTALLLHEVGHVIASNAITTRLLTILKYEIATMKLKNKMLLTDRLFRSIMSLPILDACISDKKRSGIDVKNEIKADNFVKKMGYSNELYSVLKKVAAATVGRSEKGSAFSKLFKFGEDTLDMIQKRQDNLAEKNLLLLKKECASPYMKEVISNFITEAFEGSEDDLRFTREKKANIIHEKMDNIIKEGYYTEFFLGPKKLKRIDPAELDYVAVQMGTIRNSSDKMLLITYLHNKLDMIEYYISILQNPELSKKYSIPHTLEQLQAMKKRLTGYREYVLRYNLKPYNPQLMVQWPVGYEG